MEVAWTAERMASQRRRHRIFTAVKTSSNVTVADNNVEWKCCLFLQYEQPFAADTGSRKAKCVHMHFLWIQITTVIFLRTNSFYFKVIISFRINTADLLVSVYVPQFI